MMKLFEIYPQYSWKDVEQDARLTAVLYGLAVQRQDAYHGHVYQQLPVTLFPSACNKVAFSQALSLQPPVNLMMHKVGSDYKFIQSVLGDLGEVDTFTDKLLNIHNTVLREGVASKYSMGIFRSDYLINEQQLRQVEVNAISAGFPGLAPQIRDFHEHIMRRYVPQVFSPKESLPANSSLDDVADALLDAHAAYGDSLNRNTAILFVVEENVVNVMDQKLIENKVIEKSQKNVFVFRRNFRELDKTLSLGPNKQLLLKVERMGFIGCMEISVVYFRTAYAPADFTYENAWDIRLRIERSSAIKCPSIQYQLAGVKRFQSELTCQSIFEHFVDDSIEMASLNRALFNTFVNFYPIDHTALDLAVSAPHLYVLKPNREGGGNNYFDEDIIEQLEAIVGTEQAKAYTMMSYIESVELPNLILRSDISLEDQVSRGTKVKTELGIYGTILTSNDTGEVVFNRTSGHLLRAKEADSNEAGIMAGSGALTSPLLV